MEPGGSTSAASPYGRLARDGVSVGRDRTWRLMRALGLAGATRSRRVRTTVPAPVAERPADPCQPGLRRARWAVLYTLVTVSRVGAVSVGPSALLRGAMLRDNCGYVPR